MFDLLRLPGGYDAVLCYETSPVLMAFPGLVYAKLHRVPFTIYVLDLWPENLYSVLPVKNRFLRQAARSGKRLALPPARTNSSPWAPPLKEERLLQRAQSPNRGGGHSPALRRFYACPCPDQALAAATRPASTWCSPAIWPGAKPSHRDPGRGYGPRRGRRAFAGADRRRHEPSWKALVHELGAEGHGELCRQRAPADIPRYTSFAAGLVGQPVGQPRTWGSRCPQSSPATWRRAKSSLLASMDGEARRRWRPAAAAHKPRQDDAALAENMLALYRMSEAGESWAGGLAWYQAHYRRRAVLDALENFIL